MPGEESGLRVLVAAGGTGGHLYPALAVARKLLEIHGGATVTFTGSRRGLESRIVPQAGFPLEMVRVEPLRGGSALRKLKGVLTLPVAFFDALALLSRARPRVVMGVGGYVSGPVLAVAGLTGVPTLLIEPNATPGLANRWLRPFVDSAALAWEETKRYFPAKGFVSGNPVREAIARVGPPVIDENLRLLVFGGSQGSRALNRAVVDALPFLEPHKDRVRLTHQTGEAELKWVQEAYRQAGLRAQLEPYLDAMDQAYAACDLVVCRAGATTCAELAAAGRPSVLVPLALAGGHQRANAEMMQREGAALMLPEREISGERLARVLIELMGEPERRRQMAARARVLARPDAARIIAERLLGLAARRGGRGA